ncbi:MAG TPA: helix-turn-helix domain-containing protein [Pseudonocardiaceae bacterium]|jgi:DNA-binding HxlR family transcriptional regulator|nr:helix-turn-helix domain-containing protein [Pseudonocardiaceae bacterium]
MAVTQEDTQQDSREGQEGLPQSGSLAWSEQDPSNCSVTLTLDVIGKPWILLILREIFRGLRRFDEIQRHIGVSPPVLSRRLAAMVEAGLLDRVPYREEGSRERSEYRLTDSGRELFPVLIALRDWGDAHLVGPEGPASQYRHRDCGAEIRVELVCAEGHRLTGRAETVPEPGPGARPIAGQTR